MTDIFVLIIILGLFICLVDWRKGMLVSIAAGFLADPMRKLIPGEPVYMVVLVGVFVAVVIFGFYVKQGRFRLVHLGPMYGTMKVPVMLFLGWLVLQSLVSLVRYGSPVLVGIGLLSYLAPIPGFLIAYYYGLNPNNIIRFLKFYVIFAMVMLSGIFLSYYGYEWEVLKEVGTGVLIYIPGGILDSYPGFLRSTEGAAWHAAAAISLILVLVISRQLRWPKIVVAGVILALLVAGLMTGRRKMLMEVVIFVSFYGVLLAWFRQGASRLILIGILIVGLVGVVGTFEVSDSSQTARFDPYLQRGSTVFGDADERFTNLGLNTVVWAIRTQGVLGGGLGVASQGAQHFGGGAARFGGAGEGGLGKIVSELGLPGLFFVVWIALALFTYLWRMTRQMSRYDSPMVNVFYGLIAFLGANVPLFIVATQVFGDLFVLLLLGWLLGFAVAISQVVMVTGQTKSRVVDNSQGLQLTSVGS